MSFLDKLKNMAADVRQKHRQNKTAKLKSLLDHLDKQIRDAAELLEQAAKDEAASTARGYIEFTLNDEKNKPLQSPPGQFEKADIENLEGYRILRQKADELGLTLVLNADPIHTMVETQNDNMAFWSWRIRISGWG